MLEAAPNACTEPHDRMHVLAARGGRCAQAHTPESEIFCEGKGVDIRRSPRKQAAILQALKGLNARADPSKYIFAMTWLFQVDVMSGAHFDCFIQ